MNVAEDYLSELRAIRATGASVPETSYYPALSSLFNTVGATLSPKVRCIVNLADTGAGIPDGGLFTADQFQRRADTAPLPGQPPARGAIEIKPPKDDARKIAQSEQVARYLAKYGIVIVTNLREFLIVERDPINPNAAPIIREGCAFAADEKAFWKEVVAHPRAFQQQHGAQFLEFIQRACLHAAPLSDPKDVAWFLASYAKDALERVRRHSKLPALKAVRDGMEEALGMKFAGEKGEHFFQSTLVQTIFYGVFSAWVRWHKDNPGPGKFDWRTAGWTLHVPFIRTLYDQLATPQRLGNLGLVEVLDWTAGVLNRVRRKEFFAKFAEEHAVQYFYEPFLAAFDPALRKELGVWYTPPEIVKYQVARVDTVLREELDIPDGLADPRVIVLDPCCGTGAYLVEVLNRIAQTVEQSGSKDGLSASDLKTAAMERVFGFEILPAPFVVAHLQLGLLLRDKKVPLSDENNERVAVYLTNALTGWKPPTGPKKTFLFPELGLESDAADSVKRDKRILVVLGNPPYNAYAGVSPDEEDGLVEPYKAGLNKPVALGGWGIKKFNLDELYVRFFRLAERRIAEMTGTGVVSFISNHSWVTEKSFVVLRQHLLNSFDKFWIEGLHGDRKKSEYAPDGRTSETIFAISGFSPGIQQGVATSLWVKTGKKRKQPATVRFRDDLHEARAEDRRTQLIESLDLPNLDDQYTLAHPDAANWYSFKPENVSTEYASWAMLTELCRVQPANGLMEKRGGALIDIDRDALAARMRDYFDPELSWDDYRERHDALAKDAARFTARQARSKAIDAEGYSEERLQRYALRPFDTRHCYYTGVRPVWNEPRPALWQQLRDGTVFLLSRPKAVAEPEGVPMSFTRCLGDNDYQRGHAYYFANRVRVQEDHAEGMFQPNDLHRANLSEPALAYLAGLGRDDADTNDVTAALIWLHALAVGFSPAYLADHADGIRRDWPRIPLPQVRKLLESSAVIGMRIGALLDTENAVPGVTAGTLSPIARSVGHVQRTDGKNINPDAGDLAITVGWGHAGREGVTMPGKGRTETRPRDAEEQKALAAEAKTRGLTVAQATALLGDQTMDVYLNGDVAWHNVPEAVWNYYVGGYQVIGKWLSYREHSVLGRALTRDEAREVTAMIRRITAIILMAPELDDNYRACAAAEQFTIGGTNKT
jgi:hypothetical protein